MSNWSKEQINTFNKMKSFHLKDLSNGVYTVMKILADCVLEARHEGTSAAIVVQLPERYTQAIKHADTLCLWISVQDGVLAWGGPNSQKVADLNHIQLCMDADSLPDGIYQFSRLGKLYGFVGADEPVYVCFRSTLLEQIPKSFALCVQSGVVTALQSGAYFAAAAMANSNTLLDIS